MDRNTPPATGPNLEGKMIEHLRRFIWIRRHRKLLAFTPEQKTILRSKGINTK